MVILLFMKALNKTFNKITARENTNLCNLKLIDSVISPSEENNASMLLFSIKSHNRRWALYHNKSMTIRHATLFQVKQQQMEIVSGFVCEQN